MIGTWPKILFMASFAFDQRYMITRAMDPTCIYVYIKVVSRGL